MKRTYYRLEDEFGRLSLTNLAVFVTLVAAVLFQSWEVIALFGLSLINYSAKRFFVRPGSNLGTVEDRLTKVEAELERTKQNVNGLSMKSGIVRPPISR